MHEALELWELVGSLASFSFVGSAVGDGMASQSRYSFPTASGFTPTVASEDVVQAFGVQQSVVAGQIAGSRSVEAIFTASGENDMPSAALPQSLRVKLRRKEDLFQLSREVRQKPVSAIGGDEGGWIFSNGMPQRVPWAELFATSPKNPSENRHRFH